MAQIKTILNAEETRLRDELIQTYKLDPEDIIFYDGDKKPFLTYEANSVLCNHLTTLTDISVEPVFSPFPDSISVKCTIISQDGRQRSAVSAASKGERIGNGESSDQQLITLASSRALRLALKAAGIDLINRHQRAQQGEDVLDFQPVPVKDAWLGEAHLLGKEVGFINGDNKTAWYQVLSNRYGVKSSKELDEGQRANFIAFLRSLLPQRSNITTATYTGQPKTA